MAALGDQATRMTFGVGPVRIGDAVEFGGLT